MIPLLARQFSVTTIPVNFIRSNLQPWPIRIRPMQMSHLQTRFGLRGRKPDGVKTNCSEECAP
jgi:hypothetical protein